MSMKTTKPYRQGDVMIRPIAKLPASAKDSTPNDRIVLAYGEVTGHAHAIAEGEAREFTMADAAGVVRRFLKVAAGTKSVIDVPITSLEHQRLGEHPIIDLDDWYWRDVQIGTRTVEVDGAVVRHEEHAPIALPAGLYEITIQREYHPEAIRNVAD